MLMSDGSVRNAYTLKLRNMESRPRPMRIALEGLPGAAMWTDEIDRKDAARSLVATVVNVLWLVLMLLARLVHVALPVAVSTSFGCTPSASCTWNVNVQSVGIGTAGNAICVEVAP